MIDTIQLVLLLVIVILAVFLLVLGVQVFFILKDFRKTVRKMNKVLDDTDLIAKNISAPLSNLSNLSSFVTKFTTGGSILTVVKLVKTLINSDDDEKRTKRE